ncbi:hypothetical protein BC2230_20177 [Burkholderia cepacia]
MSSFSQAYERWTGVAPNVSRQETAGSQWTPAPCSKDGGKWTFSFSVVASFVVSMSNKYRYRAL